MKACRKWDKLEMKYEKILKELNIKWQMRKVKDNDDNDDECGGYEVREILGVAWMEHLTIKINYMGDRDGLCESDTERVVVS